MEAASGVIAGASAVGVGDEIGNEAGNLINIGQSLGRSKLELQRQLDRARTPNLVERVDAENFGRLREADESIQVAEPVCSSQRCGSRLMSRCTMPLA